MRFPPRTPASFPMLTRCPSCQTVFRLTSEQLLARQGRVRCGSCLHPFNALDHLAESDPKAGQPTAQQQSGTRQQSSGAKPDTKPDARRDDPPQPAQRPPPSAAAAASAQTLVPGAPRPFPGSDGFGVDSLFPPRSDAETHLPEHTLKPALTPVVRKLSQRLLNELDFSSSIDTQSRVPKPALPWTATQQFPPLNTDTDEPETELDIPLTQRSVSPPAPPVKPAASAVPPKAPPSPAMEAPHPPAPPSPKASLPPAPKAPLPPKPKAPLPPAPKAPLPPKPKAPLPPPVKPPLTKAPQPPKVPSPPRRPPAPAGTASRTPVAAAGGIAPSPAKDTGTAQNTDDKSISILSQLSELLPKVTRDGEKRKKPAKQDNSKRSSQFGSKLPKTPAGKPGRHESTVSGAIDNEVLSEIFSKFGIEAKIDKIEAEFDAERKNRTPLPDKAGDAHRGKEESGGETRTGPATVSRRRATDSSASHFDVYGNPQPIPARDRIIRATLVTILGAIFVIEILFMFRHDIARALPDTRPGLVSVCKTFGCAMPLPRDKSKIKFEYDFLQDPDHPSHYIFSIRIRNEAAFVQDWPSIELILSDIVKQPIIHRVFTPDEWAPPGQRAKGGIVAGGRVFARLDLQITDNATAKKVSRESVEHFYP
jgi:predicted Zn finger-like uncharacterized protein